MKFLLILLLFSAQQTYAQAWRLVGDNGNGAQIYVDSLTTKQDYGYVLTFNLKEHIRDTVVASIPQYIDKFISYRCYPDTIGWKAINIHDTTPALYWQESSSTDFLGLSLDAIILNVIGYMKVKPTHP